jgi:hypothetical protein
MSPGQTIAFGILWLSVIFLGALVLLVYREVERAYSVDPKRQSGGLLEGVPLPDLEVVEGTEVVPLPGLRSEDSFLMVFVKQTCRGCESMLKILRTAQLDVRAVVVVLEGRTAEIRLTLPSTTEVYEAAYPDDTARNYGITVVPLAYVVEGGKVLVAGSPENLSEVQSLVDRAHDHDGVLTDSLDPTEQNSATSA